jgi:diguanylate cyclase (GGDEF)-like protein
MRASSTARRATRVRSAGVGKYYLTAGPQNGVHFVYEILRNIWHTIVMRWSPTKTIIDPLSSLFNDDGIDDDLLRYLVGTLYLEREPLFASIVMGALVTGLAWAMTHEAVFIAYSIANVLIGAARLRLLHRYRRDSSSADSRAATLAYDFAFSFWSTLYAIVLGLACYSLMVLPVSVGAQPLALAACAGFTIACVTRSSGRMRLLVLQVMATSVPMLTACLTSPIANGRGYASALGALVFVTLVLGKGANAKIVELYRANNDNLRMARFDMLTGLRNRFAFSDALRAALARTQKRSSERFALITIDLDRFKEINDTLGHMVGDEVIVEMATRLSRLARADDTVARMGGDEFVIIARGEGLDANFALGIANRAVDALSQPFAIAPMPAASASVGVAMYPEHGATGEELMKNADIALYEAKRAGRNRAHLFNAAMQSKVDDATLLEVELQKALADDQFEAWFQPIENIENGEIVGYEALARWLHPVRGLVQPDRFVPFAEHSGSIVAIGERILEKACVAAAGWPTHLTVAVNLSPGQFRQPKRLVEAIKNTLLRSGLAPSRLFIEITESLMLDDTAQTRDAINELAGYGVRFSLDDFGVGYSSLSYIQSYPFSRIKIDKKFIDNIDTDRTSAAIIAAVFELAARINVDIVAEGVETRAQQAALRNLGVTLAQGYLYGHPATQIVAPKRLHLVVSR